MRFDRAHDSPETAATFAHLAGLDEGPERELLREEVVEAWLPVAHRIARSFRDKGESIEDLRQVAAVGLLKAVNNYDPQQGPFESYAIPTIRGELRRHFRDHMWDVHVPSRVRACATRFTSPAKSWRSSPAAARNPASAPSPPTRA